MQTYVPDTNRLLAMLPCEVYDALQPSLERVSLSFKQVLQEPNIPMSHVYFPFNAVGSMLISMKDGTSIEVATVGNEGMVGLSVFLGEDLMPITSIVQIPGEALRMPASTFKDVIRDSEPVRDIMRRYVQALFVLTARSAACNRVHDINQRCARWLLMTRDRVNGDQFPLTQEFLSQMLGVRRAGVSEVASRLQQEGLIDYSRGMITIVDGQGLEARSCECYFVIKEEFERALN